VPLRMRLKRLGSRHNPHYRVVIADSRAPRDGRTVEEVGYYNPRTDPPTLRLREDRVLHWLLTGAEPTETVYSLLRRAGLLARLAELRRQRAHDRTGATEEA
jgi:small subunit ribosomal protein S16